MKIILLGSTGFLGKNLKSSLIIDHDLFSPSRNDFITLANNKLSLSDQLIQKIQESDICINCIADTNFISCKENKDKSIANILIPELVTKYLTKKSYVIHFSSDIFYENESNNSSEESALNLNNDYAVQKRAAEAIFLKKNSLILRTSFYGKNHRGIGLLNHIQNSINENRIMQGWGNVYSSSVHVTHIVQLIKYLVSNIDKKQLFGIYNYGTKESYSKYEYIKKVFEKFKLTNLLEYTEFVEAGILRNKNSGMSSSKIETDLNIKLPSLKSVIDNSINDITIN